MAKCDGCVHLVRWGCFKTGEYDSDCQDWSGQPFPKCRHYRIDCCQGVDNDG